MAKLRANLAALTTLRTIQAEDRPATPEEQVVLARWAGWGAVPGVFEARTNHPNYQRFAAERQQLRQLLSDSEYAAAERTTLNAHYTDAAYAAAIWDVLGQLGFDGGDVLEPGCGSGNFLGLAPSSARMVGVELDPISAAIAGALYPHAQVRAESFADTRAPAGAFDAVVGNVPFGDIRLTDSRYNQGRHSIHNHFIIKSLHLTRPGGLVAVLTSRYTMDAANPAARREMAQLADLVAAVRLPSGAHQAAAGTAAITDLLILRRREADREPAEIAWEQTREVDMDGGTERINEYFADRPDRVLGQMAVGRGMHRDGELLVHGSSDTAADLVRVLQEVVDQAHTAGLTLTGPGEAETAKPVAVLADTDRTEGHLEALPDGTFTTVSDGQVVNHPVPKTQAAELRQLLQLRDSVTALLAAEAASLDDGDELGGDTPVPGSPAALRQQLNTLYDQYVATYGPLNRFSLRPIMRRNSATGRTEPSIDPDTGEPKMMRIYPQMGKFRQTDPHAATVFALEVFDDTNQTATKADIFHRRVILPRVPPLGAETPQDALAICLDQHGEVNLAQIARLLGVDEAQARAALGDLVYEEPDSGRLVEAPEYLSGNVRQKLRTAQAAAEEDPRFEANVRALQQVLPRELGPGEIDVRFGAPFVSPEYVQQFLREILEDEQVRVLHLGGSDWQVRGSRSGVLACSVWGTHAMPAPELAQRLLTKTPIRVFQEVEPGKRALDADGTAAAQAKAVELEERLSQWVWEDPQRAADIATIYNDAFNATVPRSYVGVQRSLPGLSETFKPRPHQVEAVARIISEPAVGLFHCVGAGKTAVMAISAMEQRRLGLVNKPAIVVPNHMLEQVTREFLQIYPQARLLAAGRDDLPQARRRRFVARAATGNWDAIILAASFFERLSLSPEEQRRFLDSELQDLREKIVRAGELAQTEGGRSGNTVKRLQKALARKEERIKEKLDKVKDPGVTFEQTGIDFIYRDELHELKNDTITSSIPDAGVDGSDRAVDFRMKLDYLRRTRGLRVVCGATATPIANSVRELYVVTRQLRPDLLESTGTKDFDAWASVFAKVVNAVEVSPTGQGFQMRARLAKYSNVPELSLMMRTFGDVRTPEDLDLPTPLLTRRDDGQRAPHIVTIEPSDELQMFIASLDERVERIRSGQVDRSEDNMLKVSHEARSASLDLRLINEQQTAPGKIDAAAQRIATIWQQTRDNVYLDNPTPGTLQLVFCDLGTPHPERWNVYDALTEQLVAHGMPREQIRYIHEADTDAKKASLFAQCRSGEVAVLIGSTAKMGVGTNVQTRAIALHHLDCPWRPADVTQREGRILRQGNQNPEVSIYRYVVTGSFDAFSWQTVARKGTFIDQIMRGTSGREIDDVSDETLQAHQVKAIATGNPLLMDREQLAQDVTRLERQERSHYNTQAALRRRIADLQEWIGKDHDRIAAIDAAIKTRVDTRGGKFAATVAGNHLTKRPDAGRALRHALGAAANALATGQERQVPGLAHIGGFDVTARLWHGRDDVLVSLTLEGIPDSAIRLSMQEVGDGDPTGLVRRLENQLRDLEGARQRILTRIEQQQEEITRAHTQLDQPFARSDELRQARRQLRAINAAIDAMAQPEPETAAPPAAPVTLADWMPPQLADTLSSEESSWLRQRVQLVASDGALQAAARDRDLDAFGEVFDRALAAKLGDPDNPQMAVAVLLKYDDEDWRQSLLAAAGEAVHTAVRATPPPTITTDQPTRVAASPQPDAPTTVLLSDEELATRRAAMIADLTRDEQAWINQQIDQFLRDPKLHQVVTDEDLDRFTELFDPAFDAAMRAQGPVAAKYDTNQDLRTNLQRVSRHYVATKLRQAPPPTSSPARAAAIAAVAFPTPARSNPPADRSATSTPATASSRTPPEPSSPTR